MHITDLLAEEIGDFAGERKRLEALFSTETSPDIYGDRISLEALVEWNFNKCKIRGTSVSVNDLLKRTAPKWDNDALDGLLLYCEIIMNLIACVDRYDISDVQVKKWYEELLANIKSIADKTGHKLVLDTDGILIVVKENALASAAIADLDDKTAALAVLEYNRVDNKGNLKEKRELLVKIARFLEPKLKDKTLMEPRRSLADDIGFVLNNFNVRHNNDGGGAENGLLKHLKPQELEIIYDHLYRAMLLFCEFERYEPGHELFGKFRKLKKDCDEKQKGMTGGEK